MNESKKYNVTILGEIYSLVSNESEDHVRQSAELVNTLMKDVSKKSTSLDVKKIAVLAALCMASNVKHLEAELAEIKSKQEELTGSIDHALVAGGSSLVA